MEMNWAVSIGLINGVKETELAHQATVTRIQIATVLMCHMELAQ